MGGEEGSTKSRMSMSDNDIRPELCPICGRCPATFINRTNGIHSTRCVIDHVPLAEAIAGIGKNTDESIFQWNLQISNQPPAAARAR